MIELTTTLGVALPLIQGPMAGVSGPRLVAAVANAGALGVLPIWADKIEVASSLIGNTQKRTNRSFAVNLRADLCQTEHIAMAAHLGVSIFHLFWGDPSESAKSIRARNCKFIATVSDEESAKKAIDSGAIALVAQGVEAGGHVLGELALTELLERILPLAGNVPVVAAGGITEASGAQKYIRQGARGILYGSRFAASEESEAHKDYKTAIIQAGKDSTVRSICFDIGWSNAPHRTIRNSTYDMWEQAGFPVIGERPGESDVVLKTSEGRDLKRYFALPPKEGMTGDITATAMYAGMGIAAINSVVSVENIVNEFKESLGL